MIRTLLTLAIGFILGIWFGSLVDLERFGLPNKYTTDGVLESPLVTTAKKILRIDDSDNAPSTPDSAAAQVDISQIQLRGGEAIMYVSHETVTCQEPFHQESMCIQTKDTVEDEYSVRFDKLRQFEYVEGHEYVLIVKEIEPDYVEGVGKVYQVQETIADFKVD